MFEWLNGYKKPSLEQQEQTLSAIIKPIDRPALPYIVHVLNNQLYHRQILHSTASSHLIFNLIMKLNQRSLN